MISVNIERTCQY